MTKGETTDALATANQWYDYFIGRHTRNGATPTSSSALGRMHDQQDFQLKVTQTAALVSIARDLAAIRAHLCQDGPDATTGA